MKKISVIIVTYNSADLIIDCIDSIYQYNDIGSENVEIIVVDNSPDEESQKMFALLKQSFGKQLILIKNNKNLGYGHGNNIGINHSTGEIICIMNPDVRLIEPLFSNVEKQFEKKKKLGLLGYKQKGGKNLSFYIKPEYFLPIINSLLTKITNRLNIFSAKYFYLSGAFLFIDKSKFQKIGMFDENIFMYFEEPDISNRLLSKNYQILFNKEYEYNHIVGDRNTWSENTFKIWLSSVSYYLKKTNISPEKYLTKKKLEFRLQILIAKMFSNKTKILKIENQYKCLISKISVN